MTYRAHGTGSLQPIKPGIWRSQVRDDTGKKHSRTHHVTTKKEAQAEHDRFRTQIVGGELATVTRTVAELLDAWYTHHRKTIKANTDYGTRRTIALIVDHVGATRIDKLTTHRIDKLYDAVPPSNGRKIHSALNQAFAQAIRWGWVNKNPVTNARRPRMPARRPVVPTPDQFHAIVDHTPDTVLRVLIKTAAHTGARRGELLALQWRHITGHTITIEATVTRDTDGSYVRGHDTKTGGTRTITIDPATALELRAWRAEQTADRRAMLGVDIVDMDPCYVFSYTGGDTFMTPDAASKGFQRATQAAGWPEYRFHDLRHAQATWLLSAGAPITEVARRLGHANANITLGIYAHAIPGGDQRLADTIGEMLTRRA